MEMQSKQLLQYPDEEVQNLSLQEEDVSLFSMHTQCAQFHLPDVAFTEEEVVEIMVVEVGDFPEEVLQDPTEEGPTPGHLPEAAQEALFDQEVL